MNITWASVAWLLWSGTMVVAAGGAVLAGLRTRGRRVWHGGVMLLGASLMFAFVSAVTGLYEIEGYFRNNSFWISLLIGGIGAGLFGHGLKKVTSHGL